MSILIKGAKMPKNCCECAGAYCDNNRWLCTLAGECVDRFIYVECGRPTFCPLVEIPPHGDLIDKDKLKDKINIAFLSEIGTVIDDAPTVIESEDE